MMQLLDVYHTAIKECNRATILVSNINELYSNNVTSDGRVLPGDIRSCVIDGAFLMLFTAFERFLQSSFLCYMMGQPGLNGNTFTRYVIPFDEENALNMIKGNSKYADFTNRDTVIRLAKNFFDGGGTYSYLDSISSDFEEMKKIRNAISHISIESEKAFHNLVRTKVGSIPHKISTSIFLNMNIPKKKTTFFICYKNIVVSAVDSISNPVGQNP